LNNFLTVLFLTIVIPITAKNIPRLETKMMRTLACLLLLLAAPLHAQWYESTGVAAIKNDNNELARTHAIENALKKALLVAGASVSSVQQVVNGLLTQDEINIRASGSINSFELIDETYTDNQVEVTIRADIFPQERQCYSSDYKKTLLLTKSTLKHREHANVGGIYALDKALTKRLSNTINRHGMYLDTKLSLRNTPAFSRYVDTINAEEIKNMTMAYADITNSQYVLYAQITDVSFANEENSNWKFWQEDVYDRHFNLSVYIYNGINGDEVFSKEYYNSAPWEFTKRAQVDVNSQSFWQSQYGAVINDTLAQVTTDIDDNMMCQPTRGKIVKLDGNQLMINLGRMQGVKLGDEFSLLHLNNFKSPDGKTYAGFNVSNFKVKVTQVNQTNAIAMTEDQALIDSIQVNDLAVRY